MKKTNNKIKIENKQTKKNNIKVNKAIFFSLEILWNWQKYNKNNRKREKTQIPILDPADIKRLLREYYEQLNSDQFSSSIVSDSLLSSPCLQSFPASGAFSMSQFFTSGGQSIDSSASVSVLPMTIQGWFPLGMTGLVSLQSKGLSKVFSSTTVVQKHQFFGAQPFLHPYMTTGKTIFDYMDLCWQSNVSAF